MSSSPNLAATAKDDMVGITGSLALLSPSQAAFTGTVGSRTPETESRLEDLLLQLGVEPTMTVQEAATIMRWSYWKARRYFCQVEGICVSHRPKRYKRPYRVFTIPVSIFAREWQKMTGHEPEPAEIIRHRVATAIRK